MSNIDKICLVVIFLFLVFAGTDVLAERYNYTVSNADGIIGIVYGESDSPVVEGNITVNGEIIPVEGWFSGLGLVEVVGRVNGLYKVFELEID